MGACVVITLVMWVGVIVGAMLMLGISGTGAKTGKTAR
jgi:hypothetical protein